MNGVTARSLQRFVCDTYGEGAWSDIVRAARIETASFELLLDYPGETINRLVDASARQLGRDRSDLLEDLGIFLVAHPEIPAVRRLLRYGGCDFERFLNSLDDLPDRTRLAFPTLVLPTLRIVEREPAVFDLYCGRKPDGMVHVVIGVIRAMADDYGALAMVDLAPGSDASDADPYRIEILVPSSHHFEGRDFQLGGGTR